MAPFTKRRILAGINKAFAIGFDQLGKVAIIAVVPAAVACKQRAQRMMKIVVPLGVERITTALAGAQQARVVIGAFGKQKHSPVETACFPSDGGAQFLEKRHRRAVKNRVDCIEAQRIKVKINEPLKRVLNEVLSHVVAVGAIEVESGSPR